MKIKFLAIPLAALAISAAFPAQAEPASADTKKFIEKAGVGIMFGVESSKLALQKTTNPEVLALAQKIVDEHTAANTALKSAVNNSGLTSPVVPVSLDKDHQEELAELTTKTGRDFDEEYLDDQADVHEDTVKLFEGYSKDGDNAALKEYAAKTLPTLQAHKAAIDSLDKKIN
jgi:putative membrane protein